MVIIHVAAVVDVVVIVNVVTIGLELAAAAANACVGDTKVKN